nr:hypothetical protein [Tanacetum cinerariifolium]
MVAWIMKCVTSTSFSLSINGSLHGYFKGKRGLRQGDPLSPYLFTLVMEVFTLMLRRKVRQSDTFKYHRYCADLDILNLCFADDLFIFAYGDPDSARVIMHAMEEFRNASGLIPSLATSTVYFCNVVHHTKMDILQILPFEEGRLPVKYLGVSLVSSRLVYRDCQELLDRIRRRISDWKNKSLSAAGRLQLVRSVLSSMHLYWASVFILPNRIILEIEQLMRRFLWDYGDASSGKAKVSWEVVCLPKMEGGLGIRRLDIFNKALMVPHIWNLLTRKDSIGNGSLCSLWFDRWSSFMPLADVVSNRELHRAGFTHSSTVKEAISNGSWSWPGEWFTKYPMLSSLDVPTLGSMDDTLEWYDIEGVPKKFSVHSVWESIRPRSELVDLALYMNSGEFIPLDLIDIFWRTLNFSPATSLQRDNIRRDTEINQFKEHFNKAPEAGKRSFQRK